MFNAQTINDRLKNFAKQHGITDVTKARVSLCLERIIARLGQSDFLANHLIYGGGFVLYKESNSNRYTMDADAVVAGIGEEELIKEVNSCLSLDLDDGFWFGDSIIEKLQTESGYGGIRFKILYKAGLPTPSNQEKQKLRRVHLDISIGVDLTDIATKSQLTSTLDIYENIDWNVYPPEFICAEKIHCLLDRKSLNTRGKDVYDLNLLFNLVYDNKLIKAIKFTFQNRSFKTDSMYKLALEIDPENLKTNFNKSQFKNLSLSFDDCWNNVLLHLKKLDTL